MEIRQKYLSCYAVTILAGVLIILFAEYLGLFNGVNMYAYDLYFRIRGRTEASNDILVAAIDEKSLSRLGRWPISRRHYVSLLDRVKEARVVGFDIVMAEPTEDDMILAKAMKRHGKVVLPVYIDSSLSPITPVAALASFHTGHVHIEHDSDGIARRVFHTLNYKSGMLPSFSSVMYEYETSSADQSRSVLSDVMPATALRINYYGPSSSFRHLSFSDIVEGKYPSAFFAGKTVIVGVTAAGIEEKILTPFARNQKLNKMSGVEVHAQILNNLLDHNDIKEIPDWMRWASYLIYSSFIFILFLRFNERISAIICLLAISIAALFLYILFSFFNIWLGPASLFSLLLFMFLVSYFVKIDKAATNLENAYVKVIQHLSANSPETSTMSYRPGLFGILSEGRINSSVKLLTKITDRLMELDHLKFIFIAAMSHELRTPLNSVIGFSNILLKQRKGPLNAEQEKLLMIVSRAGNHLLTLINDVIDISKIEAGKVDKYIEDFDLQDLLHEAVDNIKKDAEDKQLEIRVETVPLAMHSDRRRLFQCVLNLLSNAVKYSLEGSVLVQAKVIDAAGTGRSAQISVTDTGIGIKEEDMHKLFGSFERLDSPLKSKVSGAGIGLYLTRKLITEILHGTIFVESTYGSGSRFTINVPVRVTDQKTQ